MKKDLNFFDLLISIIIKRSTIFLFGSFVKLNAIFSYRQSRIDRVKSGYQFGRIVVIERVDELLKILNF